jgi:hypothetical protein
MPVLRESKDEGALRNIHLVTQNSLCYDLLQNSRDAGRATGGTSARITAVMPKDHECLGVPFNSVKVQSADAVYVV